MQLIQNQPQVELEERRAAPKTSSVRVLLISHTCRSRSMGQPKARNVARHAGVELKVLVPSRWQNDDGSWVEADQPIDDAFQFEIGRVRWPYVGPFKRYLHHYPGLRKTLLDFRPDIIDLWEEPWGLVSAHACWLRERILPGTKIISETEQNLGKKLPPPFGRFRKYTLSRADFVIARSSEALEVTRQNGYEGPAQVVPNAVDAELFVPMDRDACRAKLGVGGFVLGYIGRMVQEKGLDDLLDAMLHCPPSVNLVLAGFGDYLPQLQAKIKSLALEPRVKILSARPLNQLPELFNALDVLVLPSRTTKAWKEQFGRVIIEAHACGIPVIGTTSGAIPEVIGFGGLTFPESDPLAIARVINELVADPARCAQMGEIGRRQVMDRYTWQSVAERMYDIYRRLVPVQHGA
jgi:glycosyltransferase involved in cell wall biosynthesis